MLAGEAREREYKDSLLEMGGEFSLSRASQQAYAGHVLGKIPQGDAGAVTELERATQLYAAGPEPGEDHSLQCQMLTHVELAAARLRTGALEAALSALEPVLVLAPGSRTETMVQELAAVRAELAQPVFRSSAQARDVDERIEEFGRETIAVGLHSFPGGVG